MHPLLFGKIKLFEYKEQKEVKHRFYSHENFYKLDQSLLEKYKRKNPFYISKQFLKKIGTKNIYAYGETPLTTMERIACECHLGKNDLLFELGAGRGRASLFLAEYIGCHVRGYEQIYQFVEMAVSTSRLKFYVGNFFEVDFSAASAIYLYGILLSDEEIRCLCKKFSKKQKIITVSYPLRDYHPNFKVVKVFSGRFPWGETEVYWNERIS